MDEYTAFYGRFKQLLDHYPIYCSFRESLCVADLRYRDIQSLLKDEDVSEMVDLRRHLRKLVSQPLFFYSMTRRHKAWLCGQSIDNYLLGGSLLDNKVIYYCVPENSTRGPSGMTMYEDFARYGEFHEDSVEKNVAQEINSIGGKTLMRGTPLADGFAVVPRLITKKGYEIRLVRFKTSREERKIGCYIQASEDWESSGTLWRYTSTPQSEGYVGEMNTILPWFKLADKALKERSFTGHTLMNPNQAAEYLSPESKERSASYLRFNVRVPLPPS